MPQRDRTVFWGPKTRVTTLSVTTTPVQHVFAPGARRFRVKSSTVLSAMGPDNTVTAATGWTLLQLTQWDEFELERNRSGNEAWFVTGAGTALVHIVEEVL